MVLTIEERDDLKGCPFDYKDGVIWTVEKAFEFFEDDSKKTIVMFGMEMNLVKICFLSEEKESFILGLEPNEKPLSNIKGSILKILNSFGLKDIVPVFDSIRRHLVFVVCASCLSYSVYYSLGGFLFPSYIITS